MRNEASTSSTVHEHLFLVSLVCRISAYTDSSVSKENITRDR